MREHHHPTRKESPQSLQEGSLAPWSGPGSPGPSRSRPFHRPASSSVQRPAEQRQTAQTLGLPWAPAPCSNCHISQRALRQVTLFCSPVSFSCSAPPPQQKSCVMRAAGPCGLVAPCHRPRNPPACPLQKPFSPYVECRLCHATRLGWDRIEHFPRTTLSLPPLRMLAWGLLVVPFRSSPPLARSEKLGPQMSRLSFAGK